MWRQTRRWVTCAKPSRETDTDPGNYPKYIRDVLSKIFKKKIQLSALLSEFVIMLKLGFLWWKLNIFIVIFFMFHRTIFSMLLSNLPTIKWRWNKFCCNYFDIKPQFDWTNIRHPCGTHARQVRVVDSTPGSLTCCVLPWRKLCIHCHKDLLMFLPLSLDKSNEWSTWAKALLKSINKEWMAFSPSVVLSESFKHVCVMFTRADTVERP